MPESKPTVPQKVLVIRIGRLGDTILATPVIQVLQQALGEDVMIDFAVSPGASTQILEMDTRINRVFPVAHRTLPWRIHPTKRELEKRSGQIPYDLVINLECGEECDDFHKFVHARQFCGRPLIEPRHQSGRHCVDTEKSIYADPLGVEPTQAAETSLQLEFQEPIGPLPIDDPYIVINPGFSGVNRPGYRSHRRWPDIHWQTLIERLTADGKMQILINGTAEEEEQFRSLLEQPGVHSLFGSSLSTLAYALKKARYLISVDTGTMHLASALGAPVVALFGPTDPTLTGPYSRITPHQILTSGIDCQPCHRKPHQKQCTFHRCMSELDPEMMFSACQRLQNIY